jgi:hypothetical protein
MDRVGVSFKSALSAEDVHARYIAPLRSAVEGPRAGIYSNYLRQFDEDGSPPEHLIIFQVRDFQTGLRLLRTTIEEVGAPAGTTFHNLNSSNPMY